MFCIYMYHTLKGFYQLFEKKLFFNRLLQFAWLIKLKHLLTIAATVLCTVHFGFVSPFFCPFMKSWPLLSTLYCFMFILSLFYCFIVLLLFGLIIAFHLTIWFHEPHFLLFFFPKFWTVITVPSVTVATIATFLFLVICLCFFLLLNICESWYIYCYTDKTNFMIFSQLLTCANALKHCSYRTLVSWATFFSKFWTITTVPSGTVATVVTVFFL